MLFKCEASLFYVCLFHCICAQAKKYAARAAAEAAKQRAALEKKLAKERKAAAVAAQVGRGWAE